MMNDWNTLPESYQQRVYKNTLATVKGKIQQAEKPTPAMVISVEAVCVDNAFLLHYLTYKVALQESEVGSTEANIPIDTNCTKDKLHSTMPGGSGDWEDDSDKATSAMPSPPRGTDDGARLDWGGLTWKPIMSMGSRAMMVTLRMEMRIRWGKHCEPMIDKPRMWRSDGIVGLTCEPVMSTGMSARMATILIQMRRKKHRKHMIDQRRMWRTEGIVLECVKIGQYMSEMKNTIIAKQMQWQAMHPKRRLYCN